MKKWDLYHDIIWLALGIASLWKGTFSIGSSYGNFLSTFGAFLITSNIINIVKYYRSRKPENAANHEVQIGENILNDERQVMLAEKAACTTCNIMLIGLPITIVVCALFNIDWKIIITLISLWIFQFVCRLVICEILEKKY
jgi:Predicted membrane protein (DUF2178).